MLADARKTKLADDLIRCHLEKVNVRTGVTENEYSPKISTPPVLISRGISTPPVLISREIWGTHKTWTPDLDPNLDPLMDPLVKRRISVSTDNLFRK